MINIDRIGVDSRNRLMSICNLDISIKPKQHVKLILHGFLKAQIEREQPSRDNSATMFSCGILNESRVSYENGEKCGIATTLLEGCIMDMSSMCSNDGNMSNASHSMVMTPAELHVCRSTLTMEKKKIGAIRSKNPATGGGDDDSIFTMGQEFNLLSQQGVLMGSDYIRYNAFKDAPTKYQIYKKNFSMRNVIGHIPAGLAVVAEVKSVITYATSAVFSGEVMSSVAPFIVGGIAATVGTAAVVAEITSDYSNQANSNIQDYMGVTLTGTTVGAATGVEIEAVPYTAQMLIQEALS